MDADLPDLNERLYGAKEIHFFDHYGRVEDVNPASYHRYFPRPEGQLAGEWTPRYMYDFWTPPMLRAVAPDAKLLVMFRDPVDRFMSAVAHHQACGTELAASVVDHQLHRGFYWQQMRYLLNYFDRDRILVLQYERCIQDTEYEAERTFAFLGVDPERSQPDARRADHIGPVYCRPTFNAATREALCAALAPDIRQLLVEFPELDGELWPSVNRSHR